MNGHNDVTTDAALGQTKYKRDNIHYNPSLQMNDHIRTKQYIRTHKQIPRTTNHKSSHKAIRLKFL